MTQTQSPTDQEKALRLHQALELMEFGIALMRQNIARRLPGSSQRHIDFELKRWLFDRSRKYTVQPETNHG